MGNKPRASSRVVMVAPTHFAASRETADNTFQHPGGDRVAVEGCKEFEGAVHLLRGNGIGVLELPAPPDAPDAVFPNNWFSVHENGLLLLYPMMAANRRRERQAENLKELLKACELEIVETLDLSSFENQGKYLEGTGSLVFDHENRTAYASLSQRTNGELVELVAKRLGYIPICFQALDDERAIYHTNVMISVGTSYVIVCLESVVTGLPQLQTSLASSGKEIIPITRSQMRSFCGNVLELESQTGQKFIVMSTTAKNAFGDRIETLRRLGYKELAIEIPTIEHVGGGSARCMLAEIPTLQPRED